MPDRTVTSLLRGTGFGPGGLVEVPGASFVTNNFWQANDTTFLDQNLNTQNGPYHYQVAFLCKRTNTPLGTTNEASSVLLRIQSTDQTNILMAGISPLGQLPLRYFPAK